MLRLGREAPSARSRSVPSSGAPSHPCSAGLATRRQFAVPKAAVAKAAAPTAAMPVPNVAKAPPLWRRFTSFNSGGRIRTCDLRVMSPTSYQTAPPRNRTEKLVEIRRRGQPGCFGCADGRSRAFRAASKMRHQGAPTDSTANAQYHADVLGLGLALGGNGAVTQVAAGGGCWTTDAGGRAM